MMLMEPTAVFTTMKKSGVYLEGGLKKVTILASPADLSMFMMSMNHEKYKNSLKVISSASCITICLASLMKLFITILTS
ncbi:Glyceraldehyde-3-phosphate dehydrogenase [Plecturocebus cupreus]